jgi:hypothetical protein
VTALGRLANLRDVASASPRLVPGVLLRSDAPHSADDHTAYDVPWPPRTVIDLRRPKELTEEHPLAGSATLVSHPIGGRTAYEAVGPVTSLAELYLAMLRPPLAPVLVSAVSAVVVGEAPVLVHCTAGKDRTGATVALVLRLIGIDHEAVIADYARTAEAMAAVRRRMATTLSVPAESVVASPLHDLYDAPAAAMATFLSALDAHEGGVLGWFLAHGGEEADVARLRERLLA